MLMQYSVLPDKEIPEEVRSEIQSCVDYYTQYRGEIVKFRNIYNNDVTYIEKLKNTLYPKFPSKQSDKALWNWLCAVLDCEQEDDFIPPKTIKIIDNDSDELLVKAETPAPVDAISDIKLEQQPKDEPILSESIALNTVDMTEAARKVEEESTLQAEQKASELKVMSLQEQLCMPSGLNMNPVRMLSPLATPNPTNHTPVPVAVAASTVAPPMPVTSQLLPPQVPAVTAAAVAAAASPCDSPTNLQLASNAASPAKFELPVRASPSPAKSDTSSHTSRTRNSPAPSPGKFSVSDIARNSPSLTPNKYDTLSTPLVPPSAACLPTANDLMAASLAQLAGQLPPNFLQADLAALFQQQQRKDYGSSSLNQLAAAAAKVGGSKQSGGLSDPNVAAAVAAYSNSFNMPLPTVASSSSGGGVSSNNNSGSKSKQDRSSKSSASSSSSSNSSTSSNSYKTKLMKELDELKNDPLKMSELIRSPEYAALLLQQAEALGATTLGTLGFGTDLSYLTGGQPSTNPPTSSGSSKSSKSTAAAAAAAAATSSAAAAALNADYNNLIQASKLLGYDSYMQQQSKQSNDLNAFLQQQMAAVAAASMPPTPVAAGSGSSSSKKQQQQQQQQLQQAQQQAQHQAQQQQQSNAQADYTALLQTYTKLFDPNNQFAAAMASTGNKHMGGGHNELTALLAAGAGGVGVGVGGSSKQKQKDIQSDMLNQLLQLEKQDSEIKALLYRQNKAADLDALFAAPSGGSKAGSSSAAAAAAAAAAVATGVPSPSSLSNSASAYYNALAQEKMQDYAAFFQQQHGKYGIPDPLSKSTLAANNMFMSPSALFKIQQESLSAMMMKPPKSTTPSSARTRESSASPALERLTPTKSISGAGGQGGGNSNSAAKYNFSAVDLAISSVPSNTPSPSPSDGSSGSSHRRPSPDLSRLYGELAPPGALLANALPKKRMEFASVADLAAPPPAKIPKNNMGDDVLNLSHD